MSLKTVAETFRAFVQDVAPMFKVHRRDNSDIAYAYLCGLIQAQDGNVERMAEAVSDVRYNALHHFISRSPWQAAPLYRRIARDADALLGGTGELALIIDESAFAKKGDHSAGVARQWNGRLGKVDNCQVGVFAALSAGTRVALIDAALYLPQSWIDDPARCDAADIPPEERIYRSKPELAMEIVRRNRAAGIAFDFVCADGLYGNSGIFCRALDDADEVFINHVHADQLVYLVDPLAAPPTATSPTESAESAESAESTVPRKPLRGRPRLRPICHATPMRVDRLADSLTPDDWQRIDVRQTAKGPLSIDFHRRQVWVWDGVETHARCWTVTIRRDLNPSAARKYCLTNASPTTTGTRLARMEAQRFWIERAFEDAKSEINMASYQLRSWVGWHHHMAMVSLALLFMTRYRMLMDEACPALTVHDIRLLLNHFLLRGDATLDAILAHLEKRKRQRERDTSRYAARAAPIHPKVLK